MVARDAIEVDEIQEATLLAHLEQRLLAEFADRVPPDRIHGIVREAASRWSDARVRQFIPILAERAARERLSEEVAATAKDAAPPAASAVARSA